MELNRITETITKSINNSIIPKDDVHRLNMIGVDAMRRNHSENISRAFKPSLTALRSATIQTGNNQSRKSSFDGFLFAIYSFR